jgi:Tol biopolymer transport system component
MKARLVLITAALAMTLGSAFGCVARSDTIAFVASLKGTNSRVVVAASWPSIDVLALGEMGRFLNAGQHDQVWSGNGEFVYFEGKGRDPVTWLNMITLAGNPRRLLNVADLDISSLSISRDGRKVLIAYPGSRVIETLSESGLRQDTVRFSTVGAIDVATGERALLGSFDGMSISRASYSPDRRLIAFVGRTDDPQTHYNIYVMKANGGSVRRLTDLDAEMNPFEPPRWSPNGEKLLYSLETLFIDDITHYDDIFVIDVVSGKTVNLTDTPNADDGHYCWSPDGRKVAFYESEAPGIGAIYVMNADGTDRKKVIRNVGSPSWADIDHLLASGIAYDEGTGRWLGSGILRIDLNTRQTKIVVPLQDSYGSFSSPLRIGR